MPRTRVKFAFIENKTKRKASYKLRQKGLFKKAHELSTLCGFEMAAVIYSPDHNEPEVFPNHAAAINTFKKFSELSVLDQSKHMITGEEFTRQRIEKLEKQILKVRKDNRVNEFTNKMHEVLERKDIIADMHPYDLNDLLFVIKQNLKQIREVMKAKTDAEGSTLNSRQPMVEPMVLGGTNSKGPRAPLLDTLGAPVSTVLPVAPATVPGGTNFQGPNASLLAPAVAPIQMVPRVDPSMVPSASPTQHSVAPLRTPQMVPLVDPSRFPPSPPPSPSISLNMFPPMVLQMYPPSPQQMGFRRSPGMTPPMPPTTMASQIPSSIMTPPRTTQMDPSMNIPQMGASMTFNNYQNYSVGFPQSPPLSEMLELNVDDVMTLIDDPSFNNINVQDPNHNNL